MKQKTTALLWLSFSSIALLGLIAFVTYFLTMGIMVPNVDYVHENLTLFIFAWPLAAFLFYILLEETGIYTNRKEYYEQRQKTFFTWLTLPALTWLPFALIYLWNLLMSILTIPYSSIFNRLISLVYLFLQMFIPFPILKDYSPDNLSLTLALTLIVLFVIILVTSLPSYRKLPLWQRIVFGAALLLAMTAGVDYALLDNMDSIKYFLDPSSL
jgi:hypothetical protein